MMLYSETRATVWLLALFLPFLANLRCHRLHLHSHHNHSTTTQKAPDSGKSLAPNLLQNPYQTLCNHFKLSTLSLKHNDYQACFAEVLEGACRNNPYAARTRRPLPPNLHPKL